MGIPMVFPRKFPCSPMGIPMVFPRKFPCFRVTPFTRVFPGRFTCVPSPTLSQMGLPTQDHSHSFPWLSTPGVSHALLPPRRPWRLPIDGSHNSQGPHSPIGGFSPFALGLSTTVLPDNFPTKFSHQTSTTFPWKFPRKSPPTFPWQFSCPPQTPMGGEIFVGKCQWFPTKLSHEKLQAFPPKFPMKISKLSHQNFP